MTSNVCALDFRGDDADRNCSMALWRVPRVGSRRVERRLGCMQRSTLESWSLSYVVMLSELHSEPRLSELTSGEVMVEKKGQLWAEGFTLSSLQIQVVYCNDQRRVSGIMDVRVIAKNALYATPRAFSLLFAILPTSITALSSSLLHCSLST